MAHTWHPYVHGECRTESLSSLLGFENSPVFELEIPPIPELKNPTNLWFWNPTIPRPPLQETQYKAWLLLSSLLFSYQSRGSHPLLSFTIDHLYEVFCCEVLLCVISWLLADRIPFCSLRTATLPWESGNFASQNCNTSMERAQSSSVCWSLVFPRGSLQQDVHIHGVPGLIHCTHLMMEIQVTKLIDIMSKANPRCPAVTFISTF